MLHLATYGTPAAVNIVEGITPWYQESFHGILMTITMSSTLLASRTSGFRCLHKMLLINTTGVTYAIHDTRKINEHIFTVRQAASS